MMKIILILLIVIFYLVSDYTKWTSREIHFTKLIENNQMLNENMLNELSDRVNQCSEKEDNCGEDWISYSNTKCYKVLNTKGTQTEAKTQCSVLDSTSTLMTIASKAEQEFISEYLKTFNNVSSNIWIGLELISGTFEWIDETERVYENWGENATKDGAKKCVQMSLKEFDLGKWKDDSSETKYLVVCQKKQWSKRLLAEKVKKFTKIIDRELKDIQVSRYSSEKEMNQMIKIINEQQKQLESIQTSKNAMNESLENLHQIVERQQHEIGKLKGHLTSLKNLSKTEIDKLKASSIPIGFIYVQLPNEKAPGDIWPTLKWQDISSSFAGVFFRVEGGGSAAFGQVQDDNVPRIDRLETDRHNYPENDDSTSRCDYSHCEANVPKIGYSVWNFVGGYDGMKIWLRLHSTTGEVRPRNMAIKVWKRIE